MSYSGCNLTPAGEQGVGYAWTGPTLVFILESRTMSPALGCCFNMDEDSAAVIDIIDVVSGVDDQTLPLQCTYEDEEWGEVHVWASRLINGDVRFTASYRQGGEVVVADMSVGQQRKFLEDMRAAYELGYNEEVE